MATVSRRSITEGVGVGVGIAACIGSLGQQYTSSCRGEDAIHLANIDYQGDPGVDVLADEQLTKERQHANIWAIDALVVSAGLGT